MTRKSFACRAVLPIAATASALVLSTPSFAQAQAPSTQELLEQIRILQKRIDQLERQQQQQQRQIRAATARPAPPPPPAPPPAAASVPTPVGTSAGATLPTASGPTPAPASDPNKPNGSIMLGATKLTLGGWVDLTGYYRSRNENRGTGTGYSSIPFYGPNPQGDSGEFGMSAQQTRLSGKIEAPVGPQSNLLAYVEMDFNNGAGGANSVQSNSYTPRLRQAFARYEDVSWQAYFLAGQAWSLAAPFKKGLDPLATWQPPTIDHNYMVGYSYLRVPMVRAIKGFGVQGVGDIWLGVEANTPQTVFGGSAVLPPSQAVFTGYPGNSGLNPQANYSVNVAPDLIAKIAIDTSFGHFDVFGVARWFRDQVTFGRQSVNRDTFGGGFGASAFVPIGKWVNLMGSIMYGSGTGRYGAGGLADVTFKSNGGLTTLPQGMGTVGAVAHLIPGTLDFYGFYGWNWIAASYFPGGGYGNPTFDNTGCFNPNAGGAGCAGNNQVLTEFTFGLNWNVLRGRYGTFRTGVQYGHVTRTAYYGLGGKPWAAEDLFMFNFRYIPFE